MLPELDSLAGHRSTFLHAEYLHDKKMQGSFDEKKERKMTMSTRLRMAGDNSF